VVSLKPGPDGQRRRKKVSGTNKSEVRAKLAELHDELNDGVVTNAAYTVAQAIRDWLADGRSRGRAARRLESRVYRAGRLATRATTFANAACQAPGSPHGASRSVSSPG